MSFEEFLSDYRVHVAKSLKEKPKFHVSSLMRCLMDHRNKDGKQLDNCYRCARCLQFIRPENMNEVCSGTFDPYTYHTG